MDIKSITKQDLDACALLFTEVFSDAPWSEAWTYKSAIQRLSHFYESKGFSGVLVEDEGVVGFALGNVEPFHFGEMFYLREMCVDSTKQNVGYGHRILESLEQSLKNQGVYSIYLTTERQIPAAQFYQKHGYDFKETMGFYAKRIA